MLAAVAETDSLGENDLEATLKAADGGSLAGRDSTVAANRSDGWVTDADSGVRVVVGTQQRLERRQFEIGRGVAPRSRQLRTGYDWRRLTEATQGSPEAESGRL